PLRRTACADAAAGRRQIERPGEGGAGEQDEPYIEPCVLDAAPASVDDREHGENEQTHDRVILTRRTGGGVRVTERDELLPAARTPDGIRRRDYVLLHIVIVEVIAQH